METIDPTQTKLELTRIIQSFKATTIAREWSVQHIIKMKAMTRQKRVPVGEGNSERKRLHLNFLWKQHLKYS